MPPDVTRPLLGRLSALWLPTLVVALVACTSTATPVPTGTPRPTATASGAAASSSTPVVFASTTYPYSITLPVGWVARSAFAKWDGTGAPNAEDAGDDLFAPAGTITQYGTVKAAWALAAPTTSVLAKYVADGIAATYLEHGDNCPKTPDSTEPVTIGGHPGTFVAWNCGFLINSAFTVVNGYGYLFNFKDEAVAAATDPADKATFTTMLGSVVFH